MNEHEVLTREEFLARIGRGSLFLLLGGGIGALAARNVAGGMVWQIDPGKCTQCGLCATHCVLDQSAVKCFNTFAMCGYCDLCTGYFQAQPNALNEGAENLLCPSGALKRRFIEEPYFDYQIDAARCTGCAKCVEGCLRFGNGSLYLQISHDACVHCNQCAIARACPAEAFIKLPAERPYAVRPGGTP